MTREELRDYVEEQRSLTMIPYHVYSTLIDGIDTLEQEPCEDCISREAALELAENSHRLAETMEDLVWLYENNLKALPSVQPKQGPILDKIKAEIEKQYKWLLSAEVTTYNIDIAFDAIMKAAEGEKE